MAFSSSCKRRDRTPSPFEGEDSSSSAQSKSHEVIGHPAFPLWDPWYTPSMFFPQVSSCGTTPLFMDVCFILSDSSLYDWVLETRLSFSAIVILFGLCCASQGFPGSGILWNYDPVLPIGLLLAYWFWPTGPFFCFMEFKAFSLHESLDPNSLDFSSFSSFFFPFFITG